MNGKIQKILEEIRQNTECLHCSNKIDHAIYCLIESCEQLIVTLICGKCGKKFRIYKTVPQSLCSCIGHPLIRTKNY